MIRLVSHPFASQPWSHLPEAVGRDAHGLGMLDDDSCFGLLAGHPVGRLGFSAGGLPVIFPVNFVLDGHTIVFCSEAGEKFRAAQQRAVACLEIDHFDGLGHSGWSVLATGRLAVASPDRHEALADLPLAPWALTGTSRFVEMPVELISGRTVGHT